MFGAHVGSRIVHAHLSLTGKTYNYMGIKQST